MSTLALRTVGEFIAKDANGRAYVIFVCQRFIESSDLSGATSENGGMKYLRTANREPVRKTGDGQYEFGDFDVVRFTSDDPNRV